VGVLQDVVLLAFAALTVAAVVQGRRQGFRQAGHLVAAFGIIAAVMLAGRLGLGGDDGVGRVVAWVTVVALSLFPWFLAAFAWSFERRRPRWLVGALGAVVALGAWGAALVPFAPPDERSLAEELYVLVFIALWGVLLVAAAVRLWTAGGRHRAVRGRMRLMAAGMLAMTVALFVAVGGAGADQDVIQAVAQLLALASAVLFAAAYAPPLPLRLWWRRRANEQLQRMQVALIGASTPVEVGRAVVPTVAEVLGSGVALLGPDRQVLAAAGIGDDALGRLAELEAAGGLDDRDVLSVPVDRSTLLVRRNPYAPVFGQDERELVTGLSLQVRLALERAALFERNLAAQAETERAQAELEALVYGLSHDLRSPAVAISGFASLLLEVDDPETREEMVQRIQASADYLNGLVDALLDLSRVGRVQDEEVPVDLGATARLVAQRAEGADPRVEVVVEDPFPVVRCNPSRAEQLLDNLVGNAIKHGGREDLTVTIRCRTDDAGAHLEVADDGRGVPEADREAIFTLFHRGSAAGGQGSGLGLGMVRRIAESLGGDVRLVDTGTPGATFLVRLPREVLVDDRTA
jgi:signal transduction histidine kinase